MPGEKTQTEHLFTYGTLQTSAVQLATFERRLIGNSDALVGYHLRMIRIDDPQFVAASGSAIHRNLEFTGSDADVVEGTVFKITLAELEQADAYEPAGYKRTLVQLRSGLNAWVYLMAPPAQEPSADPN